ncbi:MAG TPA: hypothetical protein VF787_08190 [Thermoanaerobaculia bacterium]
MRIAHVLLIAAVLLAGVGANADNVQGSVFLMPVTSQFSSFGTAEYLSTLNQRIVDDIAGVHSVSGPQVYSTTFSESDGLYDEFFEGPADPGACYSTELTAWAVGDFGVHQHEATWQGSNTRCAPGGGPGGGGEFTDPTNHNSTYEPLILDLNGDGIQTTRQSESPVWFDLDGNGIVDLTAWTSPDHEDGFLYVDWNRNRTIDGGRELFGDATIMPDGTRASHGYEALSAHDDPAYGGNGDGQISRQDRVWSRLRLWVDRNHDGLVSNSENYTLAQADVVSISLDYEVFGPDRNYGADENDNLHLMRGAYGRRDRGQVSQRALHEVWFVAELH